MSQPPAVDVVRPKTDLRSERLNSSQIEAQERCVCPYIAGYRWYDCYFPRDLESVWAPLALIWCPVFGNHNIRGRIITRRISMEIQLTRNLWSKAVFFFLSMRHPVRMEISVYKMGGGDRVWVGNNKDDDEIMPLLTGLCNLGGVSPFENFKLRRTNTQPRWLQLGGRRQLNFFRLSKNEESLHLRSIRAVKQDFHIQQKKQVTRWLGYESVAGCWYLVIVWETQERLSSLTVMHWGTLQLCFLCGLQLPHLVLVCL